jgi:threonine synthase
VDYFFKPLQFERESLLPVPSLWRYLPFLPSVPEASRISLGEANTPLIKKNYLGLEVFLKDETVNPTGSFKDRGMCLAISMAKAMGLKNIALPSAGNAAIAAATYALAGGVNCCVYLPKAIPEDFVREIRDTGAEVVLAGKTIAEAEQSMTDELNDQWFNLSTLKEPYRIEGKKTMGLEIAEQLDWGFPDVVVYPAGGGTGLIGIWKAFQELRSLDWVRQSMPRMVAVQTSGCAPVVKAFQDGEPVTSPWPDPYTRALGLNVPSPLGGAWMLSVLGESKGTAVAVLEDQIDAARKRLAELSGVPVGPEAAAAWRGLELLQEQGWIKNGARVVVLITGDDRRYS